MSDKNETRTPETRGDKNLSPHVPGQSTHYAGEDYDETFSALTVLRETFFPTK